ncbi:MAG TPA: bifunctional metallophosphatase/5'-nucleotidase [Gemmatimonadales bacterium]|nr:bifunctional metallophosphatase/5'-nucleotidase [Gemmatimonadales bacterium]
MKRYLGPALIALISACIGNAPPPIPLKPVRFLVINDVYVADTTPEGQGGLARVATVRNRLADTGPILFVLAGDVLSPSLGSKYFQGRQMIAALNAAKLDYATFGNHEFDFEADTLVARIRESKFKWISSNCTKADGTAFPGVLSWDTLRVSGHKVGLFGLTLQERYPAYVRCANPDTVAHRMIQALADEGADLIVGLTHQTMAADRELLGQEPKLDLILGGHDHIALDSAVTNRHVVKADANARSAQFVTVWGGKNEWRQATGLVRIDASLPADTLTGRVVQVWEDSLRQRLGPVHQVGSTSVTIEASGTMSRRHESVLGDLVTDAMRAGTGADVALINAGALRLERNIAPGPITNYELEAALPFADQTRVISFPISGAGVRRLLEHGVAEGILGSGGFLQVSGLSFTFDPAKPSGSRIAGDIRRESGHVLQAGDTLTLAFGTYSACTGGDGYSVPEAAKACMRRNEAPRALDLLTRYITDSLKGNIAAPSSSRIIRAGPRNTNPG